MLNGQKVPQQPVKPLHDAELAKPTKVPKDFDKRSYLFANPDVAAAGMDAAKHWLEFGYRENRRLR